MTGPLPGYLAPLAMPASWAYGRVIAARNRRFERGRSIASVNRPVISVGNITAGGAGKTPMVRWLARLLLEHGHRPVIAMRGYRAHKGQPSDEQQEHTEQLPQIDALADPDRIGALSRYLPAHRDVDCVLLDDGFQHRQLHRDLDLVLIDASRRTLDDRLLPAGFLREPPGGLRRAGAVIMTRAEAVDDVLAERVRHYHDRPPIAWSRHIWRGLRLIQPEAPEQAVAVDWLAGKRVLTMFGIGEPQPAIEQVRRAGAEVAVNIAAGDHQRYTRAGLRRVGRQAAGLDATILTGKDWVKVRHVIDFSAWPTPIVVPRLKIDMFQGAEALIDLVLQVVS